MTRACSHRMTTHHPVGTRQRRRGAGRPVSTTVGPGISRVDDLQIGTPNQINLMDETKGARHG
jgi:hypothetical protein